DCRDEVIIAAGPQETDPLVGSLIPRQQAANVVGQLELGQSGTDVQGPLEPELRRHHVEELIERVQSDRPQHDADVVRGICKIRHIVCVPERRKYTDRRAIGTDLSCIKNPGGALNSTAPDRSPSRMQTMSGKSLATSLKRQRRALNDIYFRTPFAG